MSENEETKGLRAQLWGWALFVICGVLFTLSGLRAQDIVAVAASIIFLVACAIFIIPLVEAMRREDQSE